MQAAVVGLSRVLQSARGLRAHLAQDLGFLLHVRLVVEAHHLWRQGMGLEAGGGVEGSRGGMAVKRRGTMPARAAWHAAQPAPAQAVASTPKQPSNLPEWRGGSPTKPLPPTAVTVEAPNRCQHPPGW